MTSGANVTAVGITVVFVALTMLLTVVSISARLLLKKRRGADQPSLRAATETTPQAPPRIDQLRRVAIAAYALHEARRVSVRGPEPPSAWLRAGRQRQVARTDSMR